MWINGFSFDDLFNLSQLFPLKIMTTQLFDSYQFHDNFLHGISFLVEDFRSEFLMDIDHILQWPKCPNEIENEQFFIVSKALLRFNDVTDLSININWGESGYTTAVSGVCIDAIERTNIPTTLRFSNYYKWKVILNDSSSFISFGASSFALELIGNAIQTPRQFLLDAERNT